MRSVVRWSLLCLGVLLAACGSGAPRASATLRARLVDPETEPARARAPELIARVETALQEADEAERAGDQAAAADHATRARLFLEAAVAEAARITDEQQRIRLEREVASLLTRARRDEQARAQISAELSRRSAIATAREEAQRALEQAAIDEARPLRRQRVSLERMADVRRAVAALRARARLTIAAADSLGATEEQLSQARASLTASVSATDPREALTVADRAYREAAIALGAARRAASPQDAVSPDAVNALAETARAEGFDVVLATGGLAVESQSMFAGASPRLTSRASARIQRWVALLNAHPHGPVQVQAQAAQQGRAGDRLADQRARALRTALIAGGANAERLSATAIPSALRGESAVARARIVFVAYAVQ